MSELAKSLWIVAVIVTTCLTTAFRVNRQTMLECATSGEAELFMVGRIKCEAIKEPQP